MHISSSYTKILGEKLFRTWEFPRSGSTAKDGEKKRRQAWLLQCQTLSFYFLLELKPGAGVVIRLYTENQPPEWPGSAKFLVGVLVILVILVTNENKVTLGFVFDFY